MSRLAKSIASLTCMSAALLPAVAPAPAAADAGPASRVLLQENVFSPTVSPALQKALNDETAAAKLAGYPIKVALIARKLDFGQTPKFFAEPNRYAKLLATKIGDDRLQPVLVVMVRGLGGYALGASAKATLATLARPPSARPDALAHTAITAVAKLAAAAGHPLTATAAPVPSMSGGLSATVLLTIAIALVVVALAVMKARNARG